MKISVVILAFNEGIHISRCIKSAKKVSNKIFVIDCFSTDNTASIAEANGAIVLQRSWFNHATQFNWALGKIDTDSDWVLRLDADELLSCSLVDDIRKKLPNAGLDVDGFYCDRRLIFQGRNIRYGGVFPVKILRLFRFGKGFCESRWMDEHICVEGRVKKLHGEIIDHNLNSLSWWIEKHNRYASLAAVDVLNDHHQFILNNRYYRGHQKRTSSLKRRIKKYVYYNLPMGWRCLLYFIIRYFFLLGFLDGKKGTVFHFLQGFWYRYIVDCKIDEVTDEMCRSECSVAEAIELILGIEVNGNPPEE